MEFEGQPWGMLRCPACGSELGYSPQPRQQLLCPEHGGFPIVDGIPSFVDSNEFDKHWTANEMESIPDSKRLAAERFLAPAVDYLKRSPGATVLDAGCGDGVHVEVASQNSEAFANHPLFAMDISMKALITARRRDSIGWAFVHADIGRLPFPDYAFDVVFSVGVIALTDDPPTSFAEMCRVTKTGGIMGVFVYPNPKGIGAFAFKMVRRIGRLGGPIVTRFIADCIVPFLGVLPTYSNLSLRNATWKQCREVVLVNIAPQKLILPDPEEIEAWFARNGIEIFYRSQSNPITLWGKKLKDF